MRSENVLSITELHVFLVEAETLFVLPQLVISYPDPVESEG